MQEDDLKFRKSLLHYVRQEGATLEERTAPYSDWINVRRNFGLWPYARTLHSKAGSRSCIGNEAGEEQREVINFGSQDYLGLSSCSRVLDAAKQAIDSVGIHSAGSGVLCGRTSSLTELEERLAGLLHKEACLVYPTGWAAGFGVPSGLIRQDDIVLLDSLSHNCLQEGCHHATQHVRKFPHNDLDRLESLLRKERETSADRAIFIVLESLYSMDSDMPDLVSAMALARQYGAIVILDVAHDFGSMNDSGMGLLETIPVSLYPDVILGSFSKTFACNGGFAACSEAVKLYLMYYSAPHIFSNAHSPLQSAVANKCLKIAFSPEGIELRRQLMDNVITLRQRMVDGGFTVGGLPSPIVPVYLGGEKAARLASRELASRGLLANLVEFPAVPRGKARFRFQVMSTHSSEEIEMAATTMREAREAILPELADSLVRDEVL